MAVPNCECTAFPRMKVAAVNAVEKEFLKRIDRFHQKGHYVQVVSVRLGGFQLVVWLDREKA